MTDIFIVVYQSGVLCVYILFAAKAMEYVTNYYANMSLVIDMHFLILVIPAMIISSLKNLKMLVPLSYVSLAITVIVIFIIFYYIFNEELPPMSERKMVNDYTLLPQFFGTIVYAFTSVPVVVTVENNMKKPAHLHFFYDISLVILSAIYIIVGFCGYWRFGDLVHDSINLYFPPGEK